MLTWQSFGQQAKYCNSPSLRCPLCSKDHGKKDCPLKDNKDLSLRKCSNCGGAHGASKSNCNYYINEKKIVDIMVEKEIPRHEAKQLLEMETDLNKELEIPNETEGEESILTFSNKDSKNYNIQLIYTNFIE